jgi:hypothetical protein
MLTWRELATLRAALLFWKEEMCPDGDKFMQSYFDGPAVEPLSALDVEQLRAQLDPAFVRYAHFDVVKQQLVDGQLLTTPTDALLTWYAEAYVATVMLPST